MAPRSRRAPGFSAADSDSDSSSDDDARRVRAPSAAFMADYLRGPARRRPARSPSPPAMARAAAAPLAPPPRRAPPQQPRYYGADAEYELQERRPPPPPPPPVRVSAPAPPAPPPAVSRPLAPPPPPRAARAAPAAPERLPEPPSGGAFAAPAAARRPTRPVSPVGGGRVAANSDAARYLSALAAFGAGGARGGPAGADDGDGHSTPGSFTPSEASDDDVPLGGRGAAAAAYDYRDAVQHRRDVRPPPSVLNDDDDAYNDDGSESGIGEAESQDDEDDAFPRHRHIRGGSDDAAFSDVSLEGPDEAARRAPPAAQLTMKPLPAPLAAPLAAWDVFRGALGVAPPRPQPVRVMPSPPPQQQKPLPPPPPPQQQQRPRAASAAPAARFGRERSASPPRRPASPRGVPAPTASPATSAAAPPRPASAVWAPPEIAPEDGTAAPPRTAVLIVDPATEWRALADAAAALGHVPVAVLAAATDDPALSATAAALASPGGDRGAFALVLSAARSAGGGRDVYSMAEEARNAAAVARLRFVAVLPGGRHGVESADALAAMLGLRHAPLATVAARRDKAALGEALDAAGVPRVPAAPCRWPEDAWRFGRAAGYPILLRDPVQEGPDAGAWLCRTDAQAGAAVGRAMQLTRDPAMRRRRYVLAERCIAGDAFLANVFAMPSGSGTGVPRIHVTDLWHFQPHRAAEAVMAAAARDLEAQAARKAAPAAAKPAAAAGARERERARAAGGLSASAASASAEPMLRRAGGTASSPYDQAVLVDATLPEYAEVVSYAKRVAAAAGLTHGAGHLKLRAQWTPGRGATRPLAVLFSPTFAPGGFARLAAAAGDDADAHPGEEPAWNPFAAAVAAATADTPPQPPPEPRPRMHARVVYVAAPPVAGRLTAWDGEDALPSLRSYESHELLAGPGDRVAPAPEPGRNALAAVYLLHEEWEVIEADAGAVLSGALRVRIAPGSVGSGLQNCQQQ